MEIPYEEIMKYYHTGKLPPVQTLPVFRREYDDIEQVVGKGYKVLDFGCGRGLVYTKFLQALPYDIEYVGIDIDPSLKGKVPFPLYESLEEFEDTYSPRHFDGLFLLDVLEHLSLKEGYDTLARLNKYIDGDIVLMTPNASCLDYIYNDPQHVTIYPSHWIYGLLKHLGFDKIIMKRGKGLHARREQLARENPNQAEQYKVMNESQRQICASMGLDWYGNLLAIGKRDE